MALDLHRLLGLLDQTIAPRDGMEAHFIRVGKGEARPASPTERDWWEAVLAYRNTINAPQQPVSDDPPHKELALQQLEGRYKAGLAEKERLQEEINTLRQELGALHTTNHSNALALDAMGTKLSRAEAEIGDARQRLVHSDAELASNKALLVTQSADLKAKATRLSELETEFSLAVASGVEREVGVVMKANAEYRNANDRLAAHIAALISQLKRFIPPRIKCSQCEGIGTWYDQSTYRVGADWEGHRARDVCSACNGAGWIDNPDRDALK